MKKGVCETENTLNYDSDVEVLDAISLLPICSLITRLAFADSFSIDEIGKMERINGQVVITIKTHDQSLEKGVIIKLI